MKVKFTLQSMDDINFKISEIKEYDDEEMGIEDDMSIEDIALVTSQFLEEEWEDWKNQKVSGDFDILDDLIRSFDK